MKITLHQAAEAVERAALNMRALVETLESNPRRTNGPDVSMRKSHAAELFATARLLQRLAPHANAVRALLHEESQA